MPSGKGVPVSLDILEHNLHIIDILPLPAEFVFVFGGEVFGGVGAAGAVEVAGKLGDGQAQAGDFVQGEGEKVLVVGFEGHEAAGLQDLPVA